MSEEIEASFPNTVRPRVCKQQFVVQPGHKCALIRSILAPLVPIVYLKADENFDSDDEHFENDREPVLFTYSVHQPSENHVPLPADGANPIVIGLQNAAATLKFETR